MKCRNTVPMFLAGLFFMQVAEATNNNPPHHGNENTEVEIDVSNDIGISSSQDQSVYIAPGAIQTGVTEQHVTITSPRTAPAPFTGVPSSPEIQLYELSASAAEKGIESTLIYEELCKPVGTREFPIKSREEEIEKVWVMFTPHQDYLMLEKKSDELAIKEVVPRNTFPEVPVRCMGILTAESTSKKSIPLAEVRAGAMNFVLNHLRGVSSKIYLIDTPQAIAASRGVTSSGGGFSILPGISWLNGLTTAAIGAGGSFQSGGTQNLARLGTTFLIFMEDPSGTIFKIATKESKEAVSAVTPPQTQAVVQTVEKKKQISPQPGMKRTSRKQKTWDGICIQSPCKK